MKALNKRMSNMAWIPQPIYKHLPTTYAVAGCGLVAAFGGKGPAAISALVLWLAAGLTALWRHQHRDLIDTPKTPSSQKLAWESRRARDAQKKSLL
jgi:hypothetical protein